jgi:hypothetical protein
MKLFLKVLGFLASIIVTFVFVIGFIFFFLDIGFSYRKRFCNLLI